MNETDQIFPSVWDALEDTFEDAEDLRTRSSLLISLTEHIRSQGWTHEETMARLDLPRRRIDELLQGQLDLFQKDELSQLCDRAGCVPLSD